MFIYCISFVSFHDFNHQVACSGNNNTLWMKSFIVQIDLIFDLFPNEFIFSNFDVSLAIGKIHQKNTTLVSGDKTYIL